MSAAGIVFDVRSADGIVTPGQTVEVEATLWNGGDRGLELPNVQLGVPPGWLIRRVAVQGLAAEGGLPAGSLASWTFEVTAPPDAELSRDRRRTSVDNIAVDWQR